MREKRLDIEEELVEEKKNKDTMNKELEALQKRAKIIDSALYNAELALEAFQVRYLFYCYTRNIQH
jgi:cyanate lyase